MKLTGEQVADLVEALLDAYPSEDDLRMMVGIELDENLAEIATGKNQRVLIFNLVTWADRTGRLDELLVGARKQNSRNPALQKLRIEQFDTWEVHENRKIKEKKRGCTVQLVIALTALLVVFFGGASYFMVSRTVEPRSTPSEIFAAIIVEPTSTPIPTSTPTRSSIINPKDGAVYVYVPAVPFIMGSSGSDPGAYDNEKPLQPDLYLDAFWIMRTEVTNAQYSRCVQANVCSEPENARWDDPAYAEHPVTNVFWYQANEYAQWVGGRLPTEAEWEKVCRGTDGRIYPWGNAAPTSELANFNGNVGETSPVGSYPAGASPYGVLDMAGNVWEWTSSKYADYPYNADDGREEQEGGDNRVLRGGSWGSNERSVRCAYRIRNGPNFEDDLSGFRVVSAGF